MERFNFYAPTYFAFGKGQAEQTGELVRRFGGTRVLLVYGGGSVERSGLLEKVKELLDEAGIAHDEFGGVQPNPSVEYAREGVKKAIECGVDFILAVGGGSAIDTAKAIAIGARQPENDLWGIWRQGLPVTERLPVGVVLTIPAAGSETRGADMGLGALSRPS